MALERPELISAGANRSAARLMSEMSRLYYLSRAIHVAAELGIADLLGRGSHTIVEIAKSTGTNVAALGRLLRFLSAHDIFEETVAEAYSNTELSSVLSGDHPQSVRSNLRRIGDYWWSAVGNMEHSIRTGESAFTNFHGMPFFQYLGANADVQRRFDEAMADISDADDTAIAEAYEFSRFSRIVDVGGGRGGLLAQILLQAPDAQGVLFDQPQVVSKATRLEQSGLLARTELLGGDFFESVPDGGDCYVIKGVLHDFDDNECIRILSHCRTAMVEGGHVVIANQDLPSPVTGPHPNLTMDIQMMVLLTGRERDAEQWQNIFGESGLRMNSSVDTGVGFTLIDAVSAE